MKIIFFFVLCALCSNKFFAQNQKVKTAIQNEHKTETDRQPAFKETKHDFGKIKKGVPVTYEFVFKNTTDHPVIIESATAQCGCTTPVFPKAPIEKGASDKITVTYNAANPGIFMKQVTVILADYKDPVYLVVSGEVMPSAPQKER